MSLLLSACGDDLQETPPTIDTSKIKTETGMQGDGNLAMHLESIRQAHQMPALAAFMMKDGEIIDMAVSGYRVAGKQDLVTSNDRWGIGSFTKTMTATLAARLVEQGLISFDTTIVDVLPEFIGDIRPEHESITLKHLLSMTSGLQRDPGSLFSNKWINNAAPLIDQRHTLAIEILNTKNVVNRGEYLYSNAGYIIAGQMLERATGVPWEQLIIQELFTPLGINNVGFGPPNLEEPNMQPSGHKYQSGQWREMTTMADVKLPFVLGPAGTINMSMPDMALFLNAHLEGMQGNSNIISADSYLLLHTPITDTNTEGIEYALGWEYIAQNNLYAHGGFTGSFNLANLLVPTENIAFVAVTNGDTETSTKAIDHAIKIMFKRYRAKEK